MAYRSVTGSTNSLGYGPATDFGAFPGACGARSPSPAWRGRVGTARAYGPDRQGTGSQGSTLRIVGRRGAAGRGLGFTLARSRLAAPRGPADARACESRADEHLPQRHAMRLAPVNASIRPGAGAHCVAPASQPSRRWKSCNPVASTPSCDPLATCKDTPPTSDKSLVN